MQKFDCIQGCCRLKLTLNIYNEKRFLTVDKIKFYKFSRNTFYKLRTGNTIRLYVSLEMLKDYDLDILKFIEDKQFLSFLLSLTLHECNNNLKVVLDDGVGYYKLKDFIKNKSCKDEEYCKS